jgi:hypothetical protein
VLCVVVAFAASGGCFAVESRAGASVCGWSLKASTRFVAAVSFTANRKTQSEIEKCIKKIADGIEVFDELLDAVQEQGQKDKFDGAPQPHALTPIAPRHPSRHHHPCARCTGPRRADTFRCAELKKEIKKLQKLRDR